MYNKLIVLGNLTKDMELRYLPSGAAIGKSAIATSFKFKSASGEQKDEVCFLDFNMFGRSAEVANQYLRKGSKVLLEGRLIFEQWTAQDGTNRNRHSLRVETMKMLDGKKDNNNESYPPHQPQQSQGSSLGINNNHNTNHSNNSRQQEYIPDIDVDNQ